MSDPRHDELAESAAAYALGILDPAERASFEAHLRECPICRDAVTTYTQVLPSIGESIEPVQPPASLKMRVLADAVATPNARRGVAPLASDRTSSRSSTLPWLATAAAIALAAAATFYAWEVRSRLNDAQSMAAEAARRVETLRVEVNGLRGEMRQSASLTSVLDAPDVARVTLASTSKSSSASGHAYWSPSRGLWLSASGLPALSRGRVYQLWLVPPKQAPISAGLMTVNGSGSGTIMTPRGASFSLPNTRAVTVAITEEPAAGSSGPTTPILLAGSVQGD